MGATSHDIHVDALLSQMAMGYRPEGFIADMLFPVVNVGKQSDLYVEFSRADRLRRQNTLRAPGSPARKVEQEVGSATYYCNNYALKASVTLEDRENADPIFLDTLINGRAQFVMDHMLLDWEVRLANQVNSGSNVGSYTATASAWTGSGADPLEDINTVIDNVHFATGVRPNRMVLGLKAYNALRRNSTVRNLIFGTNNGGGYPNTQQISGLFNVEQILVGGAFQNTGQEKLAESLGAIWGDNMLVYYAPNAPTIERPSFGYSMRWNRPGLPNMTVERHPYDSRNKAEELEIGYYQDEKITGASYGFLLTNVTSNGSGI